MGEGELPVGIIVMIVVVSMEVGSRAVVIDAEAARGTVGLIVDCTVSVGIAEGVGDGFNVVGPTVVVDVAMDVAMGDIVGFVDGAVV
mmetsp:Transcript_10962/g.17342  ORF Transcript_10962/g.17342 Transcript_10962/m.17342 type:complete len:87 (+) Transcript_10962:3-263(+)